MRKRQEKLLKESDEVLSVVCHRCGTTTKLEGFSAWSFTVKKTFYCPNCKEYVRGICLTKKGEQNEKEEI